MNPFTKIASEFAKALAAAWEEKIAMLRSTGSSAWFLGQHTNPKRNAERRAKRVTSARQCKRQAKAMRAQARAIETLRALP